MDPVHGTAVTSWYEDVGINPPTTPRNELEIRRVYDWVMPYSMKYGVTMTAEAMIARMPGGKLGVKDRCRLATDLANAVNQRSGKLPLVWSGHNGQLDVILV